MDEAKGAVSGLALRGRTLATAESCTGGMLGKLITDVSGASAVYLGGVISYAYEVKAALLGVDAALLLQRGAVCEEVAVQMAQGVRKLLHADYALATTGNAGPGTDSKNPHVGEIFVACASEERVICRRLELHGDREENRTETCREAFALLNEVLRG